MARPVEVGSAVAEADWGRRGKRRGWETAIFKKRIRIKGGSHNQRARMNLLPHMTHTKT